MGFYFLHVSVDTLIKIHKTIFRQFGPENDVHCPTAESKHGQQRFS